MHLRLHPSRILRANTRPITTSSRPSPSTSISIPPRQTLQIRPILSVSRHPTPLRSQHLLPRSRHSYSTSPSPQSTDSQGQSPAEGPEAPDYLNEAELHIFNKLKSELQPTQLEVQDISGGCGSMYGLNIVSERFRGLSVVKQHRMVNQVLAEEIKGWHGVQLRTRAP